MNARTPTIAEAVSPWLKHPASVWIAAATWILLIGGADYVTGVELRVFPLYYAPISLVAWHRGRRDALLVAALCSRSAAPTH